VDPELEVGLGSGPHGALQMVIQTIACGHRWSSRAACASLPIEPAHPCNVSTAPTLRRFYYELLYE